MSAAKKWTVECKACEVSDQRQRLGHRRMVCPLCGGNLTWTDNRTGERRVTGAPLFGDSRLTEEA